MHINKFNNDGSHDYGLFQVNNRWWCSAKDSPAPNQNLCKVQCDTLLGNLDATAKCVKTMYEKSHNTWQPWATYPYCQKMNMNQFTNGCKF